MEAFRTYAPMLTQWRRMPYRDPGLPRNSFRRSGTAWPRANCSTGSTPC
ncbi:PaaX family transcriptional regulator C-terminal domain-containing protein [Streptomyces melanosporofaciens]|nr:PaaX family transcriptional regulator C-terminal domain-containing protein [Streptomyces melanosporofaciens]